MFMKWARFCHLADDGCSALPRRKASQTFSAPWIPSCTPPLCPVQIHITQNTSSCKYKYMKVEMCVWSSVCMRTAQPNAADESWLHFVMRRAVCILHHHLRVSHVYVFFSTKSMFCDGIFDMGRQNTWEKIKYITFGRPTTFFWFSNILCWLIIVMRKVRKAKTSRQLNSRWSHCSGKWCLWIDNRCVRADENDLVCGTNGSVTNG